MSVLDLNCKSDCKTNYFNMIGKLFSESIFHLENSLFYFKKIIDIKKS